jgi:hypothetical protein
MGRGTVLLAVALGLSFAGCGSEEHAGDHRDPLPANTAAAGHASLADPLAPGRLTADVFAVRDAVVSAVRDAGGVRVEVSGRPSVTTIDLAPPTDPTTDPTTDADTVARRFAWQADGEDMELLELETGRVCANLAAARALQASGNTAMGYLEASDHRYSCTTRRDGLEGFLMFGYSALDPVHRLAGLMGDVRLTDVGVETGEDGVPTRHLRLESTESDRSLRSVPSTLDLWVGADLRPVRAEFSSLDEAYGPYVATFDYRDVPEVTLPADRGGFVFHPGVGPGPRP